MNSEIKYAEQDESGLLHVVFVGHVDHGKSTVVGRLLADSNALPEGKLEQVKAMCSRNARPFEYAFLLDALKDEQAQGITIDAARCFFKTPTRRYLFHDAPGHIEFLRNMITAAARADAAIIVIDAQEGIKENSKRHGYMASMLGLTQVSVVVNKMDLVNYGQTEFEQIKAEYLEFLGRFKLVPVSFIPISGRHGENIVNRGSNTGWYKGPTLMEQIEAFSPAIFQDSLPFRLPIQDIYKFTELDDDRRIFAGSVLTGTAKIGDELMFLPSKKKARIVSIEGYNIPETKQVSAGYAVGLTLDPQIYVPRGELAYKTTEAAPLTGTRFRVNLFWMGRDPLIKGKTYKLKIGATRQRASLVNIISVLDASELTTVTNKQQIERHDVAECIIETHRPIAYDLVVDLKNTGRFVIIDSHEISGAGIMLERIETNESNIKNHVAARETAWTGSSISQGQRAQIYGHNSKFIVFAGSDGRILDKMAAAFEKSLLDSGHKAYFLPSSNLVTGLEADIALENDRTDEHVRRIGELARILTDSGQIFITTASDIDSYDISTLELLNKPNEILVIGVDSELDAADLTISGGADIPYAVNAACELLKRENVIMDYQI